MRFTVFLATFLFASCAAANKYDGLYWVELMPNKAIGDFNIACVGARGQMEIINSLITGSVVSDQLLSFKVEGEIDEFGSIAGGIALSKGVVASYKGRHRSTSARGSWKTDNNCEGRWKANLVHKSATKKERIAVYQQLDTMLCSEPLIDCLSETKAACSTAVETSIESCRTLFKTDLNEKQTMQIGQCVTQHWQRDLRVANSSLAYCIKQGATR